MTNGFWTFTDPSRDIIGITVTEGSTILSNSFEIAEITTSIPEPSTWAMMMAGFAGTRLSRRFAPVVRRPLSGKTRFPRVQTEGPLHSSGLCSSRISALCVSRAPCALISSSPLRLQRLFRCPAAAHRIGADIDSTVQAFSEYFSANGYRIVSIKVTDVYRFMKKYHRPTTPLKSSPAFERYRTYIKYGNQLRSDFGDDAILSIATIVRIIKRRLRIQRETDPFEKTVYLLHQFKRKEEIDLLRSIYGRLFFQVSIYSRRGARVEFAVAIICAHRGPCGCAAIQRQS